LEFTGWENAMDDFMKEAVKEAVSGMRQNHGGPFGAVIVKDNELLHGLITRS